MKRALLSATLLFSMALSAQQDKGQIALDEMKASFLNNGFRSASDDNTNITYTRLEIKVDPAIDFEQGEVTSYFIPLADIDFIEFDLTDTLIVDSVIYRGAHISPVRPGNDKIHIDLPATIHANQTDSISVYYHGTPKSTGNGSFVQTLHDSVPIIWTLSEPYGARDWWPCKQTLTDKIDSLDVIITTPQAYRAASNGLLVSEKQVGTDKVYHWKHRYPIATYLVCFAVSNYAVYSDRVPFNGDTLQILNYVYPEHLEMAKEGTADCIKFMQLYDTLFGNYPFSKEKYGHAEFGWGGGMEHQTMTFVTGFGFDLLSHELAHHWFGDKVTCASWQDIWLNEGFATYLNGLCYEHIGPKYWSVFKSQKIGHVTSKPNGSVFCSDTSTVARVFDARLSYSKGAMVLHMLRWVIGDTAFYSGLRSYLSDANNAYNFATTTNLRTHFETASGRDLSLFFKNWIYDEGFPSYQVSWAQLFSQQVSVTIQQTQSDPSVSFFSLPVPVLFRNATRDTLVVLDNTSSGQTYTFNLSFIADTMIFDPDMWLISANNSIDRFAAYEFSMRLYPNPVADLLHLRIESARERKVTVEVFDKSGRSTFKTAAELLPGSNPVDINTSNLEAGTYTIRVKASDKSIASTFIKIKH